MYNRLLQFIAVPVVDANVLVIFSANFYIFDANPTKYAMHYRTIQCQQTTPNNMRF